MKIALATPRVASSVDEALDTVRRLMSLAADEGAAIVCFPEAYVPGLRGLDFEVAAFGRAEEARAVEALADASRSLKLAAVVGLERQSAAGRQIAAVVIGADGVVRGYQTKNQLDPTEEPHYVPGHTRQLFEIDGLRFGVAICHEGFRYPETVRWAAVRGAQVVFHPHCTGSDATGVRLASWGSPEAPYYERAVMCRALENTVYLASVNYAFRYQESATCVIGPSGDCQAFLPYGEEGVLVHEVDLSKATGLLAARYAPERLLDS